MSECSLHSGGLPDRVRETHPRQLSIADAGLVPGEPRCDGRALPRQGIFDVGDSSGGLSFVGRDASNDLFRTNGEDIIDLIV